LPIFVHEVFRCGDMRKQRQVTWNVDLAFGHFLALLAEVTPLPADRAAMRHPVAAAVIERAEQTP
jgi:hypothetical protein